MTIEFITLLIAFSIFFLLGLLVLIANTIITYFVIKSNFSLQEKIVNYEKFFDIIIQTLNEDTFFLRGELARTISVASDSIPQIKEFNSGLQTLEIHIAAIRKAMVEAKLLSE